MKLPLSGLAILFLILVSGCSNHLSSGYGHGYSNGYGHRGHVSVGVHGRSSAAGVIGGLIVGGIIGTIIADSKNERAKRQAEQTSHSETNKIQSNISEANNSQTQQTPHDELVNGYSIDNTQQGDSRETNVQWYQFGKDGNCYLMGVDKGVTDIISAVPKNQCAQ